VICDAAGVPAPLRRRSRTLATRTAALAVVLVLVAGACSDDDPPPPAASEQDDGSPQGSSEASSAGSEPAPASDAPGAVAGITDPGMPPLVLGTGSVAPIADCATPAALAAPDPQRPRYRGTLAVDVGKRLVSGEINVVFVPDLPTDRLVFRLWAASPKYVLRGGGVTLGQVTDTATGIPLAMAAPDPTTAVITLPAPAAAGQRIEVRAPFTVQVGRGVDDRVSAVGEALRLGSVVPLLAWEPGVGWATEPPTAVFAEAVSSPAADWDLQVTAPGFDVLGTGQAGPEGHWRASAARDAAFSVGHFVQATATANAPAPVAVTVGVDRSLDEMPGLYLDQVVAALEDYSRRWGPYPWSTLTLAVTDGLGGGIEYPGHIQQGPDTTGRTTSHEAAHQWFYGLVGNNQGRDPWVDEGVASYAEFLHDGTIGANRTKLVPNDARGRAGEPMSYWETHKDSYYRGVYVQPAVALAALGDEARLDCALRGYVATQAFRIARPADLLGALAAELPDAPSALAAIGIR
jgi:hypothetical protein